MKIMSYRKLTNPLSASIRQMTLIDHVCDCLGMQKSLMTRLDF